MATDGLTAATLTDDEKDRILNADTRSHMFQRIESIIANRTALLLARIEHLEQWGDAASNTADVMRKDKDALAARLARSSDGLREQIRDTAIQVMWDTEWNQPEDYPDIWAMSAHKNHQYHGACAVCRGDIPKLSSVVADAVLAAIEEGNP